MPALLAALLAALLLVPAAQAQSQRGWAAPAQSAPAQSVPAQSAAPQPAARPAGETACDCENITVLQQELRNAITLRDNHAAMAARLREQFGANPRGGARLQAGEAYRTFELANGPGTAREGYVAVDPKAPPALPYVPRGVALLGSHAADERKGIPAAERWQNDVQVPDLEARQRIEQEWRAKGQDLCDFPDHDALKRSAVRGAACRGIADIVVRHEEAHRATCRRMGFYAFNDRSSHALAEDEVAAYEGQIKDLAAELTRVARRNKTRIISGTIGDLQQLLALKVRCALALNVVGQIDELSLKGKVCDTAETFTIPTVPNANMVLTPRDRLSGTYAYRGVVAGAAEFWGNGGYAITLENGQGTLVLDGAGRWWARNPVGTASKGGPERLRVTEIKEGC